VICVTDATGVDADPHLVVARLRDGDVLHDEIGSFALDHCGFHLFSFLPATFNPNSQAQFPINHEFLQVGIFDFHS